ncbi:hypothetical protein ACGFX8_37205 [Streptomyces sp. NPDC048362]|uniref:hypothetical protein n=1 Tax=Streptomyces sp. NPDC048362 TaxID=3365539 RepID=UPI00371AC5D8
MFGPAWPTVYRRFAHWSRQRAWARLHRVILDEFDARAGLVVVRDRLRQCPGGKGVGYLSPIEFEEKHYAD